MKGRYLSLVSVLLIFVVVLSVVACAPAAPAPSPTTAPAPTMAPAPSAPTAAPAAAPTKPAAAPAAAPTKAPAPPATEAKLLWATSAMGTPGYKSTVGLADYIQKADPKLQITVSETAGGKASQGAAAAGEANIGLVTTDQAGAAYYGILDYKDKPQKNIRMLWAAFPLGLILGVRSDTDIQTVEQLSGRTVATPAGTSLERLMKMSLEALGVEPKWQPVGSALVADMIKTRKTDGFTKSGGRNDSVTMDLATSVGIRLLHISKEQHEQIEKKYPGQVGYWAFPAGSFKGQDKEVGALSYTVADIVTKEMSADVAYRLVKALYQNRAELPKIQSGMEDFADFPKATMQFANIPLHAGAVKFYKELGLTIPDKLIPEEAR